MGEPRFTPGPWQWWTSDSWRRLTAHNLPGGRYDYAGDVLCPFVNQADGHPDCNVKQADMDLIAAAPELYEWLQAVMNQIEQGWGPPNWDGIRKVLAKARGEKP